MYSFDLKDDQNTKGGKEQTSEMLIEQLKSIQRMKRGRGSQMHSLRT